ncbi:MAG: phosphatase PAP2 family protein [archaeon]
MYSGYYDYVFLHLIQSYSNSFLDSLMMAVTYLGDPLFWLLIAAIIYWSGREKEAFHLVNLLVFVVICAGMLKFFFLRARPSVTVFRVLMKEQLAYSFPSGHTAIIGGVFGYLYKRTAMILTIGLIAAVLLVAYSRLYLGVHFPSDIIGGIILGFFVGRINVKINKRFRKAKFRLTELEDELILVLIIVVTLILLFVIGDYADVALFLGFYAGFFIVKETKHQTTYLKGRNLIIKEVIGLGAIGIAFIPLLMFPYMRMPFQFIIKFCVGLWISLLYPFIFEQILESRRSGVKITIYKLLKIKERIKE